MQALELPNDVDALRELVTSLATELERSRSKFDELSLETKLLREHVRLLKHKLFGRSSEKRSEDQGDLFDEAEFSTGAVEASEEAQAEDDASSVSTQSLADSDSDRPKGKPGRRPIPAALRRVPVPHDLAEEQKYCPQDGSRLERMGEEASEQLEFIPAHVRVLRHVRYKYSCPSCRTGITTAPMPPQMIPKSIASPALLAHVVASKYCDGLPLYRQEGMFVRAGIHLSRSSLARWAVHCGGAVQPLINLLRDRTIESGYALCDETPVQVLKEPGRRAESQSYMWVQYAPSARTVLFDYDPSRSGSVPKQLFEGFEGVLQTDGYIGYKGVGAREGVDHVGCWSHARRKFDEALHGQRSSKKKSKTINESKALRALNFIRKLYKLERRFGDVSDEERRALRAQHSKPVAEAFRKWLDDAIPRVPPTSLTGKALRYLDHQWSKLVRILDYGHVALDTNRVENAIRPFVVGRKGWLFSDSVRGAEASANLYSLVETAKLCGLEPFAYLRYVFERLPAAASLEEYEALLPQNVDRATLPHPMSFTEPAPAQPDEG